MPLILWINELFPVSQEPFTLKEIEGILFWKYSSSASKSAVYRALTRLENSPQTAPFVVPVIKIRPHAYSAEGARRIARVVAVHCPLDRDPALSQMLKLQRNSNGNWAEIALPNLTEEDSTGTANESSLNPPTNR